MKKAFSIIMSLLVVGGVSFAAYQAVLVEPDCCQGKQCYHVTGEHKHHVCHKYCHNDKQKDGHCCGPIQ